LATLGLTVEAGKGSIIVKRDDAILMTRYYGQFALDYLRKKQLAWQAYLKGLKSGEFWEEVGPYKEKVVEGATSSE
jgi:hypothetical protein